MRPRPRAPRAYTRFLPCRIVHRRGRACVPCTSTPRRPATQSPAARPTHQPRAALPSRGAGAAPRGAPGASALAPSARVRRPELVPVRRPTGVGRPGSWVWVGVRVRAVRAWCAPARAATCPIRLHRRRPPGVRVPLLARASRCWSRRCASPGGRCVCERVAAVGPRATVVGAAVYSSLGSFALH